MLLSWNSVIFILIVDVFPVIYPESRNLCDTCECTPSYSEPSNVNCNCRNNKLLILKNEDGDVLSNTKFLNISTCNFVAFPIKGFPRIKKLKSVQIKNMKLFHLNSGVFPSASHLAIEDVSEVIIDGFTSRDNFSVIEFKNVVLSEIGEDLFKELRMLEKLVFQNVSISSIKSNGLSVMSGNPKLTVKFVNSKIDSIYSEGISLQITKLELTNTVVNVINSQGLNIIASESIDIVRCVFGPNLWPESFQFTSNKINFVENEFKLLPSSLLSKVYVPHDKKINFSNNIIHDVDLGGFILNSKLDKINFIKNKIVCDCTPRKTSILKLTDLFPGLLVNDSNYDSIIDTNSCKNFGNMPLSEFKRKFLSGVMCNETGETTYSQSELMNLQQSSTEISRPSNSQYLYSNGFLIIICFVLNVSNNYMSKSAFFK